jgi:hypothetical protein
VPFGSKEKIREYMYHYTRAYTIKFKTLAYEILGNKCICCGEAEKVFLSLDHINNDGATDRGKNRRRVVQQYKEIIAGSKRFQIMCMNCNWAKRYGICPHKREI